MPTVNHATNIIELRDVSFAYGATEVLQGITLDVHLGDYLGVIGPNGAGKTTLLKVILGLLPPTQGTVKLFSTDIRKFTAWSKIGYVPQTATHFDEHFPATVQEVVLMGRYARRGLLHPVTSADRAQVTTALHQVDMVPYRTRLIGDLSGGQQQRVFIARALVSQPEVIFLDEPTTGIDQRSRDEFYALLRTLNREFGLTLVLVSHDIAIVTQEVMHIACIDHTLVCHTSPAEFLKESQSFEMFGQTMKVIAHHRHHA